MASDKKFKLTVETKLNAWGIKLFRIEATVDIVQRGVKKGDKGGWLESEEVDGNARVYGNAWVYGNAEVYGDAWVYGNAEVYGNARVSGKKAYTKGWFIGGDDTGKITRIEDQMGTDYWPAQYVLGDFEINDIDPPEDTKKQELLDKADELIKQANELRGKAEEL